MVGQRSTGGEGPGHAVEEKATQTSADRGFQRGNGSSGTKKDQEEHLGTIPH